MDAMELRWGGAPPARVLAWPLLHIDASSMTRLLPRVLTCAISMPGWARHVPIDGYADLIVHRVAMDPVTYTVLV
jgi:hypothetical protein